MGKTQREKKFGKFRNKLEKKSNIYCVESFEIQMDLVNNSFVFFHRNSVSVYSDYCYIVKYQRNNNPSFEVKNNTFYYF